MAEKWANASGDPSSGVRNPKPFVSLNELTTPVFLEATLVLHLSENAEGENAETVLEDGAARIAARSTAKVFMVEY